MKYLIASILSLFSSHATSAEQTWDELVVSSKAYMQERQQALETEYQLSKHDRWNFDQSTGELVFSDNGIPAVIAKFQFIGSFSESTNTWLWSWGNSSIAPELSNSIQKVQHYGEKHGFKKLIERKWAADQNDGWEMAAVTNYLLRGNGIYRPPFNQGVSFLLLTDIRRVPKK